MSLHMKLFAAGQKSELYRSLPTGDRPRVPRRVYRQLDSHSSSLRSLGLIGFWLMFLPLLLLFCAFGLPVIGNYFALKLAYSAGCTGSASGAGSCYLWGRQVGDLFYNYAVGSIFLGLFNPIYFFQAMARFFGGHLILVWLGGIAGFWYMWRGNSQERKEAGDASGG